MKFSSKLLAAAAVAAAAMAAPAGAYTLENIGDGNGTVVAVGDGYQLTGSDGLGFGSYTDLFYETATGSGTVTYDYSYATTDLTGDSYFDPAGYYLDGVFTQLTTDGTGTASGSVTFNYTAGDEYGFYVSSDGQLGAASITFTPEAVTPPPPPGVPEPATWAMMISGFGLVGGALRARRSTLSFGSAA